MKKDLKKIIIEKGQGLTEYVLILAFIAGVAFMMFGGNGSLKGTVAGTLTETVRILGGLFGEDDGYITASKNYRDYYLNKEWKKKKSDELAGISNEERLKADREGLALIASLFLELDQDGVKSVKNRIAEFSNAYGKPPSNSWMAQNLENYKDVDGDGWSDVLVPLSYRISDFDTDEYLWLEASNNAALIKEMTGENTSKVGNRTAMQGRLFYSDGMIGSGSTDRAIALKVHYATEGENIGKVDKVLISAKSGVAEQEYNNDITLSNNRGKLSPGAAVIAGGADTVPGLDLTVTGTKDNYKYKVNN